MERNYRERNRYYRDNYDDYSRNKDKNRNRSYKIDDNYRNRDRDKPKEYRNRNIYNYVNRDDKYRIEIKLYMRIIIIINTEIEMIIIMKAENMINMIVIGNIAEVEAKASIRIKNIIEIEIKL